MIGTATFALLGVWSLFYVSDIILIILPFKWVGIDILPYVGIFLLAADDVIVVGFLPDRKTSFSTHRSFELLNDPGYGRGVFQTPAIIRITQHNDHMNMIRHHHILIDPNIFVYSSYASNFIINNPACVR